jgi:hypothetical protein
LRHGRNLVALVGFASPNDEAPALRLVDERVEYRGFTDAGRPEHKENPAFAGPGCPRERISRRAHFGRSPSQHERVLSVLVNRLSAAGLRHGWVLSLRVPYLGLWFRDKDGYRWELYLAAEDIA